MSSSISAYFGTTKKIFSKAEKHLKNIALFPFLDFCQDFQVKDQ